MMNRRKFLRGVALSPIAVAAVSLPKEAEAKPKSEPKIQPLPEKYYITTLVSVCDESTVLDISDWRLES